MCLVSCATPPGLYRYGAPVPDAAIAASAHLTAGDAARARGQSPEAASSYRDALAHVPDEAVFAAVGRRDLSFQMRLDALGGLGAMSVDPAEGVAAYQAALETLQYLDNSDDEGRAQVMLGLGGRLRQAGRCEEALAVLGEAVVLLRRSKQLPPEFSLNLGNVHLDCGDLALARSNYDRVLQETDRIREFRSYINWPPLEWLRASALRGLASVDLVEGKVESASRSFDESLAEGEVALAVRHPNRVRLLDLQACIFRRLGDDRLADEASAFADAIVEANPSWFPDPRVQRGLNRRLESVCGCPSKTCSPALP